MVERTSNVPGRRLFVKSTCPETSWLNAVASKQSLNLCSPHPRTALLSLKMQTPSSKLFCLRPHRTTTTRVVTLNASRPLCAVTGQLYCAIAAGAIHNATVVFTKLEPEGTQQCEAVRQMCIGSIIPNLSSVAQPWRCLEFQSALLVPMSLSGSQGCEHDAAR